MHVTLQLTTTREKENNCFANEGEEKGRRSGSKREREGHGDFEMLGVCLRYERVVLFYRPELEIKGLVITSTFPCPAICTRTLTKK